MHATSLARPGQRGILQHESLPLMDPEEESAWRDDVDKTLRGWAWNISEEMKNDLELDDAKRSYALQHLATALLEIVVSLKPKQ